MSPARFQILEDCRVTVESVHYASPCQCHDSYLSVLSGLDVFAAGYVHPSPLSAKQSEREVTGSLLKAKLCATKL
jgi:hypothetical protein